MRQGSAVGFSVTSSRAKRHGRACLLTDSAPRPSLLVPGAHVAFRSHSSAQTHLKILQMPAELVRQSRGGRSGVEGYFRCQSRQVTSGPKQQRHVRTESRLCLFASPKFPAGSESLCVYDCVSACVRARVWSRVQTACGAVEETKQTGFRALKVSSDFRPTNPLLRHRQVARRNRSSRSERSDIRQIRRSC